MEQFTLIIVVGWFLVGAIFIGSSASYFLYMKRKAGKFWQINANKDYKPSVAILVPVHNEEKTIQLKLKNLERVIYPTQTEIVIVNDSSTDKTLEEIGRYTASNMGINIRIFTEKEHLGKTKCMNLALKSISADVVIVSDADCFWPSDILLKALPFLSDPSVGAVSARELLLNPEGSWVTEGEQFFDNTVEAIRIGESKIHSTIFFHGGFAAFKRSSLGEFDLEVDDSGTALSIIQKDSRTLLLPETGFFTPFPTHWRNKLTIKIRRASQLQQVWAKCLKLLIKGKLRLPNRIALPEIFLHIFNPELLIAFVAITIFGTIQDPIFFAAFFLFLCFTLLIRKTRTIVLEVLQNNLILLAALSSFFTNKGFRLWKTVQESRSLITEDALKQKNLV